MTEYKPGQQLKITIVGTVKDGESWRHTETLGLITASGKLIYVEGEDDPAMEVEELGDPIPTEDGWYESEKYPINSGYYSPYRLYRGKWTTGAGREQLSPEQIEYVMPLTRLGRT